MLNDRPISYGSNEINDSSPVTPSQLIYGYRLTVVPDINVDESILSDPSIFDQQFVTRRQAYCKKLLNHYWQKWRNDYLLALRERDRNLVVNESGTKVNIEDIVLIHDECPRSSWKLGKILSLNYGSDGFVRPVILKTAQGKIS